MTLRDIDDRGRIREVVTLDHQSEFDRHWSRYTDEEQAAIVEAIDAKLDELALAPPSLWGSIMNTSLEGAKVNPFNGQPGDWDGTPWSPIYDRNGQSEEQAALFFGTLWKWRVIEHSSDWIGIRSDPTDRPTFPQRGVSLQGKTYFLDKSR
jgi:hypothetical protein